MNQSINEPNQGSKNVLAIIAVAIITALVVGGGVYLQQKSMIKNERNEIAKTVRGEFQQEIADLKNQLSQLKETQNDEEVKPPELEDSVVEPPVDSITETSYTKVLLPNGGEELVKGKTYNIKWNCFDDAKANVNVIDIYIKDKRAGGDGITSINSFPVNCFAEKYSWQVKDIPSGGNRFKIQLRGVAGSADLIDESDDYFSIVE